MVKGKKRDKANFDYVDGSCKRAGEKGDHIIAASQNCFQSTE